MADDKQPHLWIPADRVHFTDVVQGRGGSSYSREDVAQHSASLLEAFEAAYNRFAAKEDIDITGDLIVEITTAEEWPASRERQHLRNLGFEILAISPDAPNVAIARIPQAEVPRLQGRLRRYAQSIKHIGKGQLGAIEGIQPVSVHRKIEPTLALAPRDVVLPCLISVYASLPPELKQQVADRVVAFLRERGKEDSEQHFYANGSVIVSARLNQTEMAAVSEQFMLVRSIESNGDILMETAVQADPVPTIIHVEPVRCQTPVAVIDSGVNSTTPLLAGLVTQVLQHLPPGSVGPHMAHGTFVASRVIYGDDITTVLRRRASPWCPIVDVQVTGVDAVGNRLTQSAVKLGEILQTIVPQLTPDVRVYNISLGVGPVSDGYFSELAKLVDFLSREHKALFVISAGNINDPRRDPPTHYLDSDARILFPSEALLAVTVGSVAKYVESHRVAAEQEISPFSRRGPGADSGLKPEVAAHGGNAVYTGPGLPWTTTPRVAAYGLGRSGTHLEYSIGTSFAAPLVSQYAARLFDAYPSATPNLVRALLYHFTEPVRCPAPGTPIEDYHFCGFGEPNIDRALYAAPNAATMLYQGQAKRDKYLHVAFHVPAAVAGDPRSRLMVRGTVVFDPPVAMDDPANYSLCRVAGLLRKRAGGDLRDVTIGGAQDDVLYPWNPLIHFQHRFRHGYDAGEWEFRLRLMVRGNLPNDFAQDVAVVLEIVDVSGTVPVRASLLTEHPNLYVPIQLRIAA